MQKQISNARIAAVRAQGQKVFISGIQGQHTLEMGVAYHYRGHYIYACPAGNPIEPVPFSTKKGINVVGTISSAAPKYDPRAPELVPESSVAALKKSCEQVWVKQQQEEEERKREVKQALDEEKEAAALPTTALAPTMPSISVHAPEILAPGDYTSSSFLNAYTYTPHDRARFLSDSAPGSRFGSATNTPYTSRPVSPSHSHLRASGPLRQVASTTHLSALLADSSSDHHALSDVAEGTTDFQDATDSNSGIELGRETNSDAEEYAYAYRNAPSPSVIDSPPYSRNKPIGTGRPRRASMALNQAHNATLSGTAPSAPPTFPSLAQILHTNQDFDKYTDNACNAPMSRASSAPPPPFPALTQAFDAAMSAAAARTSTSTSSSSQLAHSRQQSRQSLASQAVDTHSREHSRQASTTSRVLKCAIHGEDCDGVSTSETWKTQYARNTLGLKENFPVILGDGDRVMVDWVKVLQEEKAVMGL